MSFFQKIILKIKKIFFNKERLPLLSLSLIVFFSLFSPSSAGAVAPIIAGLLGGALSIIQGALIVIAIYAFIELISIVFVGISGALLNWVTSPNFVSISYTNPSGSNANLIVKAGLDITKNFVNLALVVILVYIAVAIALRLGENNAKKLFAKLIIVALLVNFAPLLVGLIVDATNIIMNYFLKGIEQGIANVLTQSSELGGSIFTQIWGLVTFQSSIIARGLIMIVLNFATGIALLLYAILFIFRYIAIWTIVILSPLAFVAWILPATKKYWDMWWSNLVQWSIIGIPMAFFLYLGARCYEILPALFKTQMQTAGIGPEVAGLMNQTFPYFVVLAFLYLGFVIGLQTSAMGATSIIGWSKKAGGWVGGRVGRGVKTWTEEKAQIREKVGGITKKWEEIPIARWFVPERMRKYAEMRPAIDEAQKKLSIHSSPEISHRAAVGDIYGKDAVGGLMEVIERGDSNDWFKQHMLHYGIDPEGPNAVEKLHDEKKYREKMARLLQIGLRGGRHNTILRGAPRLATLAPEAKIPGYEGMSGEEAIAKAVSEARNQHIKNWEVEDVKDRRVIEAGMARGRDFWQAIFGQVKKGHEEPLNTTSEIFKDFIKGKIIATDDDALKAWGDFREDTRKKNNGQEGFFLFLGTARAREQGWSKERIIELATGRRIKPKAPSPGGAAGVRRSKGKRGGRRGGGAEEEPEEEPEEE